MFLTEAEILTVFLDVTVIGWYIAVSIFLLSVVFNKQVLYCDPNKLTHRSFSEQLHIMCVFHRNAGHVTAAVLFLLVCTAAEFSLRYAYEGIGVVNSIRLLSISLSAIMGMASVYASWSDARIAKKRLLEEVGKTTGKSARQLSVS